MKNNTKLKLDNSANIYPFSATKKWNSVHRISAVLKADVDAKVLQESLEMVMPRFPSFNVFLKKDFSWYYFSKAEGVPKVEKRTKLCRIFNLKNNFLFRILYSKKEVAIECFHAVADGYGALVFFNTLLATYFRMLGHAIGVNQMVLDINEEPKQSEIEDSFVRFADFKKCNKWKEKSAEQVLGTQIKDDIKATVINLKVSDMKEKLKPYGYKITPFILSAYFLSLIKDRKNRTAKIKKPIKISMAINIRQFFPSKTLRNFASYVNLGVNLDQDYDMEKLVNLVTESMQVVNKENIRGNFNSNVKAEKNPIIRIMPRVIKQAFLNYMYSHIGENLYTTIFSNLGVVDAPEEFKEHIDHYECMVGASKINNKCLCCASFNDIMSLTFTSKIEETQIEEYFKAILKEYKII